MREFTDVLRKLNRGKLATELTDALRELTANCVATGKKGSLTLTIKMKPGKAATPVMTVEHDLKTKIPEFDRPAEYLFVTSNNDLVVENPEQRVMDLTVAGGTAARGEPIVDPETGEVTGYKAAPQPQAQAATTTKEKATA